MKRSSIGVDDMDVDILEVVRLVIAVVVVVVVVDIPCLRLYGCCERSQAVCAYYALMPRLICHGDGFRVLLSLFRPRGEREGLEEEET